jgi:ABC-type sugar transport system substrate-binding protein
VGRTIQRLTKQSRRGYIVSTAETAATAGLAATAEAAAKPVPSGRYKSQGRIAVKKLVFGLAILLALLALANPAFAKGKVIGVVIPYEIGWFTAFHQGFELVTKSQGDKIVWAYHNYKAEDETKAVENLIAQGVDAINVTSVTPQSAEYSCRLANEAGIPIQITESGIAEGKGKPFADIDFNWFDVYKVVADGLRKDLKATCRCCGSRASPAPRP